ncbi:tRNA (adenosine(37)-N6)-threonylcarbamoyltransferase complex ATPase subunit type 1 TsaE [Geminicoccus harenae]|uniref:tRNA (adenosine(37)-N6)-threonylcarbamoyltransferase complex ATPase subunit type 1 TsaE n=2 Tax=Geminicoccus harenae TaxID=2498453 RepID=UPI002795453C|nr:tRNA (adenosine(37)-N6)-threonylcarbamoyltransferase complex ATPase subunit type 1 TsaE [Geminicoccus harenae]
MSEGQLATTLELELADLAATHAFAARLGRLLRKGDLVGLSGDLGAGKSELARAAIRALAGAEIEVPSPTFTLLQLYDLPGLLVGHADLYRLGDPDEVVTLGLDEVLRDGALLVEWPEHGGDRLPGEKLLLALAETDRPNGRRLTITAGPGWADRLAELAA